MAKTMNFSSAKEGLSQKLYKSQDGNQPVSGMGQDIAAERFAQCCRTKLVFCSECGGTAGEADIIFQIRNSVGKAGC
jgi:hypothetical protein